MLLEKEKARNFLGKDIQTGRLQKTRSRQTLQDGLEAAQAGAEIVMLDNFESTELKEVAQIIKNKYPNIIIEASGGIKTDNIHHYFSLNVDVISLGLLTQGYDTLDFSLKIQKN